MSNPVNPVKTPNSKGMLHRINMIIRIDMVVGLIVAHYNAPGRWEDQKRPGSVIRFD